MYRLYNRGCVTGKWYPLKVSRKRGGGSWVDRGEIGTEEGAWGGRRVKRWERVKRVCLFLLNRTQRNPTEPNFGMGNPNWMR